MLKNYRERYRAELLKSVVPFWLGHALDGDFGGYFSCLDRRGEVYDTKKYVWHQGRMVWMLSKLYNEVERKPEWLAAARSGAEFLERNALDPGGRCYFSLTREGRPVFFQRKPYAAVFVLLSAEAICGGFRDAGDAGIQQGDRGKILAGDSRGSVLEDPGVDRVPGDAGPAAAGRGSSNEQAGRRDGPGHDGPGALRSAGRPALSPGDGRLPGSRGHQEPERRILLETVAPNGAKRLQAPEGRFFNPGHSIETVWTLLHLLRRHPDAERQRQVLDILEGSLELGWDKEFGGLYYFMDIQGKPVLPLEAQMKLWWPHTEAIYAVLLAYRLTREKKWLQWLERLDRYAFSHFADPDYGGWFGYCDRRGNLTNTCKGNNYKGMYHVARFLLMSIQEIERLEAEATAAGRAKRQRQGL